MGEKMNSDFLFLASPRVIKIMKYVKKSPKSVTQISKNTHLPIATTYRLVAQLEKNQYLKSVSFKNSRKKGNDIKKYHRGIKYQISVTADYAMLRTD